ncbi:protein escargot isoform X1 [Procambarus clarkii]|uniref:protein escargot isoform X1 n=1 Tax=Procambarus clarkii TaxID=6728 RepID=UPI0037445EBF
MVVLKSDYSSCPLKKRPLSVPYNATGNEQTEPEDLSVKFEGEAYSSSNTRTHDPCVQEPRIRTHDPCAHCPPASLLRTREPQSLARPAQEPHVPPVNCCDWQRLRLRVPYVYGETTHSRVHVRELQFPDAHGVCPQTQTETNSTHDKKVHASTESERESTNAGRQSRTPDAQHQDGQTIDVKPANNQIPDFKSLKNETPDPESRISFNPSVSASTCTSPDSLPRETSRDSHSPPTCEVRRLLPPVRATPRPHSATPGIHIATPRPHTAILVNSPLVDDISHSRIDNDRVSPSVGHKPSVQTTASWLRFPDMRVPGEMQSSTQTSQPHRPWLADDPPRQTSRQFTENVSLQPARPRPLLPNSSLWTGLVPIAWPMPHLLPPAHPPSPGRHHRECHPLSPSRHSRECGSPDSESISSDSSSSGAVRGEARYSCAECNKSYSTYSGLSKHKQFHCAALGAKSFACKHCEKVYTSLGALKMHIRTHTLPCKCQLCGKAFSRPWLLQGHIRTHTGEKPFQCPQCDRCFADRSNLRAHLQTHADVKKYACVTCHKTFSRMSLLNKHTEAACPALHRRMQP